VASIVLLDLNAQLSSECLPSWEDEQLAAGLRAGSESAYERLIERFQQPVYGLAWRLLNDAGDASDVVQEVFLKVFRSIGRFRGQSSLRTWIYRIAINESHNRRRWLFRHRHKEVGLEEDSDDSRNRERVLPDDGPSPFDQALHRERHELVEEALAAINPSFREAVILRDIEDFRYDEIAEILQISIGTVKSRILRGREALRVELAGRLNPSRQVQWVLKPVK
jgi:RNA polymerase sigma-70 factor (ECF subfamily)